MLIRITRYLWGSLAGMAIAAIGCFLLRPQLFFDHPYRGISYYGNHYPTAIPYMIGNAVSIICLVLAVSGLPETPKKLAIMRGVLMAIAGCLVVILLTPELSNVAIYWTHVITAVMLFLVVGAAALWVMSGSGCRLIDWLFFGVLIVGSVLAFLSAPYVRVLDLLALGQIMAIGAAMLIIVRGTSRWLTETMPKGGSL